MFLKINLNISGTPLQYSCLENPMDGGAWWAAVHGVSKSRARLSDFTFAFHFHALEKEMATHSSILAWRIPRTGEPGGLPSLGSQSRTDWSDLAAAAAHSEVSWFVKFWVIIHSWGGLDLNFFRFLVLLELSFFHRYQPLFPMDCPCEASNKCPSLVSSFSYNPIKTCNT